MRDKLIDLEKTIAGLRIQQVVLVNNLERSQAPQTDGSRSMVEYVQSNMDVSATLARDLVYAARTIVHHRPINHRIAAETITFDRMIETVKLAEAGASSAEVEDSYGHDLDGVTRLTASRRRVTRIDERTAHEGRYFVSQPSLDRSHFRFWGQIGGVDGHTLEKAMVERADELHRQAPDMAGTRGQRQADAMVCMALDSLDRAQDPDSATSPSTDGTGQVTVFVDARKPNPTEAGSEIEFGPRVGPDTLDRLLCTGTVKVIGMDADTPLTTTAATRRIPPAIREAVALRDGGCTIDGCRSRYRLQPHHIVQHSQGGSHHPDNLTTLCWYHHHVAIHQQGYRIDPRTPPHRRRLTRRVRHGHHPPGGHDPP